MTDPATEVSLLRRPEVERRTGLSTSLLYAMMSRGGQSADSVSTAKWDGPKLTIVTKLEMGGQVTESTQVWTVEGSTLTVETTNARGTQKRVYKKAL